MRVEWLEEAARRIARADALTIGNPRAERAHQTFDMMRAQREQGSDRGLRGFLIVGPTQSGKSKILRTYQERANTAEALEAGRIPVLMVTLTANQTRKGLAQDILRAFEPFGYLAPWKSGSETVLLDRVRAYMQARQVELLILDEFQHLVHSERQEVNISVSETIKWLLIESIVPVVMSGIQDAWRPVRANAQLAHRCEAPLELNPLDPANEADRGLFASFLSSYLFELERGSIAENATHLLHNPLVPEGLFEVAKGVLGETCNILKAALYLAMSSGRDEILLEDLELAVDRNYVAYDRNRSNPFRAGLKMLSGARHAALVGA